MFLSESTVRVVCLKRVFSLIANNGIKETRVRATEEKRVIWNPNAFCPLPRNKLAKSPGRNPASRLPKTLEAIPRVQFMLNRWVLSSFSLFSVNKGSPATQEIALKIPATRLADKRRGG